MWQRKYFLSCHSEPITTALPWARSAIYRSIKWAKWERAAVTMTQEDVNWSTQKEKRATELTKNESKKQKTEKGKKKASKMRLFWPCGHHVDTTQEAPNPTTKQHMRNHLIFFSSDIHKQLAQFCSVRFKVNVMWTKFPCRVYLFKVFFVFFLDILHTRVSRAFARCSWWHFLMC